MSRYASRFLVPVTAGAVALGGVALPAAAQQKAAPKPDPQRTAAIAASRWLAGQLDAKGGMYNPSFNVTDWGLTIDALYALRSTRSNPKIAKKSTGYIAKHVRSYNSYDDWGQKGVRVAGATGKLLVAAVVTKSNPRKFGRYDLRAESLALMATSGPQKGRFRDKGTTPDNSNAFGQSLNVLGLARSGGVPQAGVDFLIKQQCKSGGFRLSPDQFGTPSPTCDSSKKAVLDPDSTAMAVQALLAAHQKGSKRAGDAARKGALWLKRIQRKDGSFGGSGPTAGSNSNSTGLAGQALRAVGGSKLVVPKRGAELRKAADRAGGWVRTLRLTPANAGKARRDIGAIAYNRAALNLARRNGIGVNDRDQWRRSTPQAMLVLSKVSLVDLGK